MKIMLLSGILVVGGIGLYWMPEPYSSNIDPFTSSAISGSDSREYAVANLMSGDACIISRGKTLTANSRSLEADADCDSVWRGLSSAATW